MRIAILALACFTAGPALASIVPSTVPPPKAPAAPPPAPSAPVAPPTPIAPPEAATPVVATPAPIAPIKPAAPPSEAPPPEAPLSETPPSETPPPETPPPGWTAITESPPPAAPAAAPALKGPPPGAGSAGLALTLHQPEVPDTGRLSTPTHSVSLFGITGLAGSFATHLHGAIAADGGQVTCKPQAGGAYRCMLPDGTDVAALALRNGAAQTRADAPAHYRKLEALARNERRGLWASLPPPPVKLEHPTVLDTATLTAGGATYKLDGLTGLGGHYARDLQSYIQTHGDALTCNQQGGTDEYVCLLPDQTDIAELALVNGAARVAPDAPDSYRVEQGNALASRRGYWKNPPSEAVAKARAAPATTTAALPTGDNGNDGVRYIGGAPAAVIDGRTVFLRFAGAAGWGYWDHAHRWHDAPARYRRHMQRYHPDGRGLRGYHRRSPGPFAGSAGYYHDRYRFGRLFPGLRYHNGWYPR